MKNRDRFVGLRPQDAKIYPCERCKMNGDSLPRAAAIQELVTVWKQL